MSLALYWRNKLRRRFYKPFNKIAHRGRYFVCSYFGADFLVRSVDVGGLEISAKIGEYPEPRNFTRACAALKPDVFIDIGANLGLYTCIMMKNGLAPRAILFEPDRRNRVHLRANLLINDLTRRNIEIHELALGAALGRFRLVPGPERDIGLSQIVENAGAGEGYDVDIVRFDDLMALAGMARTLRDNRGVVQIEVLEAREETLGLIRAAGYTLAEEFGPNPGVP